MKFQRATGIYSLWMIYKIYRSTSSFDWRSIILRHSRWNEHTHTYKVAISPRGRVSAWSLDPIQRNPITVDQSELTTTSDRYLDILTNLLSTIVAIHCRETLQRIALNSDLIWRSSIATFLFIFFFFIQSANANAENWSDKFLAR